MTQLPQDEFETCLEKAEAWMKEIHKRLKESDNTQGPRSALECRLRETEKICALEPDGKLLLDLVLSKAENILGESSDDEKHEIHVKLGKIKAMFEETTIYMTHCHSRIEWVWLHWNEYLRTRDEFMAWVHDMTLMLGPDVELQLGRKEKCWQFEQSQVLLRDVNNHSKLLDRLLEEASSLYNRIGDPSVDESVQSAMVKEYKQIKKKTQERTKCLEKIWRDHEAYEKEVNLFKSWLNSVIEKLKCCVGSASESTETRLNMLQEIGKDVEIGKKQLVHLKEKSVEVIKDTSPLGAEKICRELEELRRTLDELKVMNDEEEDDLQKTYNSDNAFAELAVQLEGNINEFRKAVQRLEESLESGEKVKSEDELIALRKTLIATKSSLAALEAIAERVKVQLKDLFKFSKDIQPLSDNVIAAMREYQRAKSKAFKLSTDTEFELQQLFQNPLRDFLYWKPITESVLDSTAVAADNGTAYPDALDRIEKLLEESSTIKENLAALEAKKDRIHSVLGDDGTDLLLRNVTAAESEREALYRDLLERRGQIQSLAIQGEEFDSALKRLHKKLSALRTKCAKENEKQTDIIGKEAQLQRLQTLLDQLTKLHTPIKEFNSKMEVSPNHAHRASKLLSDYLTLQRSLENNIRKTKEFISCHWMFNNDLLDLQRWIMETRQNVEAYLDGSNAWEEQEVEALLVEVSEKDINRHRVEAQGQLVIESSSPEGAALINTELKQLLESWESLRSLCEQLSRSLKERARPSRSPTAVIVQHTSNFLSDGESMDEGSQSPPQNPAETTNPGKQDALQISVRYDDSHDGNAEADHGGFSDYSTFISMPGEELDNNSAYHKRSPGSQHTERSDSTDSEILRPAKDSDGQKRSGPARPASSISTDIDGYSSSSSSMADNDDTIRTRKGTQTGHTGNLDSDGNESSRGNISGKANSSISTTEVESAHNRDTSSDGNESNRGNIAGKANTSISITEVESAHKGDSSSNESNRGNISGKANASISITEVESAHRGDKGARSKITSPAHGSGSSDKSVMISTEMNKTNGKSRIPRPAGTSGSSDKSSKSVKRSTEISITNGKASNDNESSRGNIAGRANSSISTTEVESAHKGGSSSDGNESSRGNISGRANSSISITEVESAHKGGSSSGSDGRREELNDKTSFKMSPDKTQIHTRIISENSWNEGESNSPDIWGTSRRNPKVVSLAESVDVVDFPPAPSIGGIKMGDEGESNSPDTLGTSRRNPKVVSLAESVDDVDSPPAPSIGGIKMGDEGESNSLDIWGTSRRNPKVVSRAESVDVVDSPPPPSIGGIKMGDDHTQLLVEFEQWLKVENVKLNRLCAEKSSGRGGGDTWRSTLQMLKSRVPQGQKMFEGLLLWRPAMSVTDDLRLEDFRYRWMIYKSKLRDSGIRASPKLSHEPRDVTKKSGGLCSFLHRVCRAALPLQLLLLLLLLLAFLLPLVHETQNCALANNFARSFNLMLKYDGPPPT